VHFSRGALRTGTGTTDSTSVGTAGRAAGRLIHQTFLLVELLFSGGEYEVVSALTAL
jgi:hypothetical protein